MATARVERRLAAILMADVVGYSHLVEQDEVGTLHALRDIQQDAIAPLLAEHHGVLIKLLGDGILVEFASVVDAVTCAVAVQNAVAARQADIACGKRIVFRIGVNLGDVVVENSDLLGDGVNIAARLEQLCEPGGVLISGTAYDHLQGKFTLPLDFAGIQHVKNITRPLRSYSVRMDGRRLPWRVRLRQYSARVGWTAVLIAVGLAAGGWYSLLRPGTDQIVATNTPSIAVLPFTDMSGKATLAYFGDGVAEDIISMLSRVPDLKVLGRDSSFAFKSQPVDVRKIGAELGVSHILQGSIRKDADRLRIIAQLVEARTGEQVWAERFDRDGTDPWDIQDEITEKIVAALAGDAGTLKQAQYRQVWGKDHTDLEEYDYYLRGNDLLVQLSRETTEQALRLLTEGLSKFPDSALLKIKLGLAYFIRGWNGWSENLPADYQQAATLAREAMAQPTLSPMERRSGHYLSAFVRVTERKFADALIEADAAINLSPYDAEMLGALSQVLIAAGKPAQALEWIDRAEARQAANPQILQELAFYRGWALVVEGKFEESLVALKVDQTDFFSPLMQAIALNRLGRTEEAAAAMKKGLTIDPVFTQAKWRELFFYSDPAILEREVSDLASLGLPAK
ncbi:adenylate/guanylate cyclase domain-containing protein [Rhizobium sp. Root1220]|uniref:adenylate/guanylate cyclase domain-containing protein n=1 Tax=Rhizobium sp. Root1220 TaxID=1736432 RepID=UPI0006FF235B|nr:adenylate/guanylate cyclase domain-containing protein [Rhizobium sp. Root1220]KQV66203.1 hypothetical protein ASC90_13505 [Rhizobium sp. Root1220]